MRGWLLATAFLAFLVSLPVSFNLIFAVRSVPLLEEIFWIILGLVLLAIPLISLIYVAKKSLSKGEIIFFALNLIILIVSILLLVINFMNKFSRTTLL